MNICSKIAVLCAAAMSAAPAWSATTIDFSAFPSSTASYTESGVTFTANGEQIDGTNTPNGTRGILAGGSPRAEFRADFSSLASLVAVDLGDFNADPDTLFLEIFDTANQSLGFTSLLINGADQTMHTLQLSGTGISYAIFGGRDPAINGNSVYADNFTFDSAAAVPEPATWAFMIVGFGAVGASLRAGRRKQASPAIA